MKKQNVFLAAFYMAIMSPALGPHFGQTPCDGSQPTQDKIPHDADEEKHVEKDGVLLATVTEQLRGDGDKRLHHVDLILKNRKHTLWFRKFGYSSLSWFYLPSDIDSVLVTRNLNIAKYFAYSPLPETAFYADFKGGEFRLAPNQVSNSILLELEKKGIWPDATSTQKNGDDDYDSMSFFRNGRCVCKIKSNLKTEKLIQKRADFYDLDGNLCFTIFFLKNQAIMRSYSSTPQCSIYLNDIESDGRFDLLQIYYDRKNSKSYTFDLQNSSVYPLDPESASEFTKDPVGAAELFKTKKKANQKK